MAHPTLYKCVVRRWLPGALASLPLATGAAVYTNDSMQAPLEVTLHILANCVVSAHPLDFGTSQGVLASAVSASTTITVTCSNTTPYNLGLSAGSGAGSTTTTRYMSGTGASAVKFDLSQTSGGGNWGNTPGTDTLAGTGTGSTQTVTVYGRVPPQATPMPDRYVSTVTATVYF